MKLILDLATILGGIAALWFFWDRFSSYRKTLLRKSTSPPRNSVRYLDTRPFYRRTPILIGSEGIAIYGIGIIGGWELLIRLSILSSLLAIFFYLPFLKFWERKELDGLLVFTEFFFLFVGLATALIGQELEVIWATLFLILATIGSVWLMIWIGE